VRRLVIAAFPVLLSAAAYQSAVHRSFRAVTVPIVQDVTQPAGRLVRVSVPDLSLLQHTPPLFTGRLGNISSRRQRVRVILGGVVRAEVEMGPGSQGRFGLVLSEGSSRAFADPNAGHRIDLLGENGEWHVLSVEASNAHAALGRLAAVVPAVVAAAPPNVALSWAVLAALSLLALTSGGAGAVPFRRARFVAAMGASAFLVALCALPLTSGYRLLIAPPLFWTTIALLFSSVTINVARHTGRFSLRMRPRVATWWRRHPTTCERGAIFLGLVSMAIAQPLFDVLRGSPEFFVARNTTASVAVSSVALLVLGLPVLLLALERITRSVAPTAATLFVSVTVALLLALLIHPWLRRTEAAGPATLATAALVTGALLGWLSWRYARMRTFFVWLSPAALVVPVWFLTSPAVRESFTPPLSAVPAPPLEQAPPIVVVVFDEFPVHSLLDGNHDIDAARFPGFAALARNASWFREATTVSSETVWAVPAIVSGRYPVLPHAVPTLRYYPENLFTWLADRYEVHVFGRFLQLCPEPACLVSDFAVVWLHIVLPAPLTDRLPPVVGDWMGFVRAGRWRTVNGERVRNDRRSEFDRFLTAIKPEPARLYFLHALLPHMPFEYVPSERRYDAPDYQNRREQGAGLFANVDAAYADALHQRHLLQVGFVDTLVGRLIARLNALGIYDDALIVLTADHGASYREGMSRRVVDTENLADIIRVPLLIKRPGQTAGAVVDGAVETVDILPTIADALGVRLPFTVDGRSLYGGFEPRAARTFISRGLTDVGRRDATNWQPSSEASLSRRLSRFGAGSYDQLYAVPGTGHMIGQPVTTYPHRRGPLRVRLIEPETFDDVDLKSDTLPLHVRGQLNDHPTGPIAIAVNGRIAATTVVYQERAATVFATMIPEHSLRAGSNDVRTYVIERTGGTTTLESTVP
jgi:hypothetical protein